MPPSLRSHGSDAIDRHTVAERPDETTLGSTERSDRRGGATEETVAGLR